MSTSTDNLDNPLTLELELLQASYETALAITLPTLVLHAKPHVGSHTNYTFVSLQIHATPPANYPQSPCQFSFSHVRGLDDAALTTLSAKLSNLASDASKHEELHIATAFSLVEDFLTEHNKPNDCPVCMETVEESDMISMKPCLHVMHRDCYEQYLQVLGTKRMEKEEGLRLKGEAVKKAWIGWAVCAVCRAEFDVEQANAQLRS